MKKRLPLYGFFLITIVLLLSSSFPLLSNSNESPSYYQPLIQRLLEDGFDQAFITRIFGDPRAESNPLALSTYLISKEEPARYEKFLKPESIIQAKKFLKENLKILNMMEKRFQVEKEIVVAILLVESRFGENVGRYRVIPTLANMSLLNSQENLLKNYHLLREYIPELSYEGLEGFAKRRADWAYNELKYFLRIVQKEKIDPLEVYGSHAGAFGMAQFIPSSYLNYAISKNSFEQWLLNKEEAILSIGNYLTSHGWKKGLSIQKKKQILFYYNRSDPYVETIIQISKKVRGYSSNPKRNKNF